ncbi:MAG: FG-GAP-like repeat-containing protein [Acidobacteriota bacterium]
MLSVIGCAPKEPGDGGAFAAFELTDQLGRDFSNADLAGRVWVAQFFATGCEQPCSDVTATMSRLQNELFNHPKTEGFRLVSFSVDPVSDTVSALATFAQERAHAYEDRWHFATLSGEPLAAVAASVGLEVAADAGTVSGGESLVLVDEHGDVTGLYDGRDAADVDRLLADIDERLATIEPPARATLPGVAFPPDALNPSWIEPRQKEQIESASSIGVFHGFRFTDRRQESGILFENRVVDDAGRDYKGVHYDHGNGLSIADVDADGRYDLYFTTQMGRNELWRNLGDGRFENMTTNAGVGLGNRISVTSAFADFDNDGDADLFVTTVNDGNVLFRNDGGRFTDISEGAGVDHAGHSSGAVFFDYDRDGLLDLFVTNIGQYSGDAKGRGGYDVGFEDAFSGHLFPERTETSILYRNLGDGRFEDVTESVGLTDGGWNGDATMIDYDADGFMDLYVLDMQGDDDLFRNDGGQRFERVTSAAVGATPWGSMGVGVFDLDNDGHLDIFLSDMHSDMSEKIGPEREKLKSRMQWSDEALGDSGPSIFGNALYRSRGDGTFEELSQAMGAENYWPWGLSVGDVNADGWDDVLLTSSMNYPWRYGVNSLLLNENGRAFKDAEFIVGLEPRYKDGRTVTPWFEFDCAGDLSGHPLWPEFCKIHGKEERVLVEGALGTRSAVIFDLDGDGDLDIVTAEFNHEPQVLISDLAEQRDVSWLEVVLEGTQSNRDGLGARVTVSAGGLTQTKLHDGKSGYLSQSSEPVYFGLGDAAAVEWIEVAWPNGDVERFAGPHDAKRRLALKEGSAG